MSVTGERVSLLAEATFQRHRRALHRFLVRRLARR